MQNTTAQDVDTVRSLLIHSQRSSVSQQGIKWTFEQPALCGQYANGDWWVQGPVVITSITPGPRAAAQNELVYTQKGEKGEDILRDDKRMRNGSMLLEKISDTQGYDSRLANYSQDDAVVLPLILKVGQVLSSSISNEDPFIEPVEKDFLGLPPQRALRVLKSAALLTCVEKAPALSLMRPSYIGKINMDLRGYDWMNLPNHVPVGEVPDANILEQFLRFAWLDHVTGPLAQYLGPSGTMPHDEISRMRIYALASIRAMLDDDPQRKSILAIRLWQIGLDYYGLAKSGREWSADGLHGFGRKWPIIFTGHFAQEMQQPHMLRDVGAEKFVFAEDQQVARGETWLGQSAYYQTIQEAGEKIPVSALLHPQAWDNGAIRDENLRVQIMPAWCTSAVAASLLGYIDMIGGKGVVELCADWMRKDDAYAARRLGMDRPQEEGSVDNFIDNMWRLRTNPKLQRR